MQHAGIDNPYALSARVGKPQIITGRLPSQGYPIDTPPRTNSSEIDMGAWSAMPNNPAGRKASYVGDKGLRKSSLQPYQRNDVVSKHLLVETALLDSQGFELLAIEEVDALKKEKAQLDARLETTRRKLAMESKVRDAAQSLHRLYTDENGSPISPKKPRGSFLGDKARSISGNHAKSGNQAGSELAVSQKKIDELLQILSGLESRRQYVESRLLRHTSAVLQVAHSEFSQSDSSTRSASISSDTNRNLIDNTINNFLNGSGYEESIYSRDFNRSPNPMFTDNAGFGQKHASLSGVSNEKLKALQSRLDSMNSQMRNLIQIVRRDHTSPKEDNPSPKPSTKTGDEGVAYLETQLELVDKNVARLASECVKAREERDSTVTQLIEINKQVYDALQASDSSGGAHGLQPPPVASEHGPQIHLNYLEESMLSVENVIQAGGASATRELKEANDKATKYDDTMRGLWDLIGSDNADKEPFSLQGFNTRVQHVFNKASNADTQAEILRRQIQQQRELNSKSDSEKDKAFGDAQADSTRLQQELETVRDRLVAAEAETHGTRAEMDKVIVELEHFKVTAKSHEDQKKQVLERLQRQETLTKEMEQGIADYEARLSELQDDARLTSVELDAKNKDHDGKMQDLVKELHETRALHQTATKAAAAKNEETQKLEAEVIRLTTELTVARAELDGAYGSRAERAKEGGSERMASLEKELAEMAEEYQELTRESVAAEKEREQLEALVDGLRERCETVEAQLSDEKVRWLGISSPTAMTADGGREMTSAMVLRTEFKKMMRETRAEYSKTLRAEQEERRRLEALVRSMRRDNVDGKTSNGVKPTSTVAV